MKSLSVTLCANWILMERLKFCTTLSLKVRLWHTWLRTRYMAWSAVMKFAMSWVGKFGRKDEVMELICGVF